MNDPIADMVCDILSAMHPLPAVIDAMFLSRLTGRSLRSAQRMIAKGECGRYFELGGKRFVRREEFVRAIKAREVDPRPPRGRPPVRLERASASPRLKGRAC